MVTQERLRELFEYNPDTGLFTRIKGVKKGAAGTVAGVVNKKLGYVMIGVDLKRYYAHRLAFVYMLGYMPEQVDHIDRDRTNNRWSNLREASNKENNANKISPNVLNGGYRGVRQIKSGRWAARIKVGKREKHIGVYATKEHAARAYNEAAKILFGDFAVLNNVEPDQRPYHFRQED
jgi:hypothetical protein